MDYIEQAYELVEKGNITEDTLDEVEELMEADNGNKELAFAMLLEGINLSLREQQTKTEN